MCGRFTVTTIMGEVAKRFQIGMWEPVEERILEPFNVSPSQEVLIVADGARGRELILARWGFRPAWMLADSRIAPINARAETVASLPMFRDALRRSRCLIPADGFYEWRKIPGERKKQPVHFRLRDGGLFAFAGLWTTPDPEQRLPPTAVIITTTPNEIVASVHNRMPAILAPHDEGTWIDHRVTRAEDVTPLLRPFPADQMEARVVIAPGPLG